MNKIEKIKNLVAKIAKTEECLAGLNRELKDLVNGTERHRETELVAGTTRQAIYDAIKAHGPIHRTDLLNLVKMPKGTVSSGLSALKDRGLIEITAPGVYKAVR